MGFIICKQSQIMDSNKIFIDSFNDYSIYFDSCIDMERYQIYQENNAYFFLYGNVYETETDIKAIRNAYRYKGASQLFNIDGDFIFVCISHDGGLTVISDREGMIPLYYRKHDDGLMLTTSPETLFYDFSEKDIDIKAVNSFLRFGMLVGNQTLSKRVRLLEGGSELIYDGQSIKTSRIHLFHYYEEKINNDELIYDVYTAYKNSIKKRIKNDGENSGLFLSGGLDSRFLLAASNECLEKRLRTVSFGQEMSEEVEVARKCAQLKDNPFQWVCTNPEAFLQNIEEYSYLTCGADMFPQSYIIGAIKQANLSQFMTGFELGGYLKGIFLTQDCIDTKERLSCYIKDNLKRLKLQCLSEDILKTICTDSFLKELDIYNIEDLQNVAKEYDTFSVADSLEPFVINTRGKRLVLQREVIPGRYAEYSNPSIDLHFLRNVAKIPATQRLEHKFYREMFCKIAEEYSYICYNNTTLPINADTYLWKQGTRNEEAREKLYEEIIKEHNSKNDNKIYYPHFYSDFNGYSRYDRGWELTFEKYLLNRNSYIYENFFVYDRIKQIYEEHKVGKKNYRKELICLTSLEIFFQVFLFRNKNTR